MMGSYADTHERDNLPPIKGNAPMPLIVSALALGTGLTLAGLGLVVLLMLLTMHPRATPTLIWGGRLWHLRTVALALGVASALCLMVPRAEWSAGPPRDREAEDASHGPRDEDASRYRTGPSASVVPPVARVPGTLDPSDAPVTFRAPGEPSVALTPPAGRARAAVRPASPPEPLDLTGEWTILNTVVETSYPAFQQLQLGFRVTIQHEGQVFHGVGAKTARTRPADPTCSEAAPPPPRHGRGGRSHCGHISGRGVVPAQHRAVSSAAAGPLASDGDICQHGRSGQGSFTLDPDVRRAAGRRHDPKRARGTPERRPDRPPHGRGAGASPSRGTCGPVPDPSAPATPPTGDDPG
jgi:hypothetical protein